MSSIGNTSSNPKNKLNDGEESVTEHKEVDVFNINSEKLLQCTCDFLAKFEMTCKEQILKGPFMSKEEITSFVLEAKKDCLEKVRGVWGEMMEDKWPEVEVRVSEKEEQVTRACLKLAFTEQKKCVSDLLEFMDRTMGISNMQVWLAEELGGISSNTVRNHVALISNVFQDAFEKIKKECEGTIIKWEGPDEDGDEDQISDLNCEEATLGAPTPSVCGVSPEVIATAGNNREGTLMQDEGAEDGTTIRLFTGSSKRRNNEDNCCGGEDGKRTRMNF